MGRKAYSNWNDFRDSDFCKTNQIVLVDEGFKDSNLYEYMMKDFGLILIGFKHIFAE